MKFKCKCKFLQHTNMQTSLMHSVCIFFEKKNVLSDRLNITRVKLLQGSWAMSFMRMVQRMRMPFFHTLTALDVAQQAVLSPLNAGDCVPRLQKQVGIDPSSILELRHAGTCRRGRRALTGCALKRRVSAAHHVYAIMIFILSVRRQEYLMKVIFSGNRCSAVGPTVIRQGTVSQGLVVIWCGLLVVFIFYIITLLQNASVLNTND